MSMIPNRKNPVEHLENAADVLLTETSYIGTKYTANYVDAIFTIWYKMGKVGPTRLSNMIPEPSEYGISSSKPSENTLRRWIENDSTLSKSFLERAEYLDEQVANELQGRLIAEKVAMLDAHTVVAKEMQDMALTFLRENKDKLNSNSAVRLLVEGVRIERESRGIPRTLEKLAERSDEELMDQIEDMLLRSSVEIKPLESGE